MLISGRRLGLDYGDARIGVSISDATAMLASPLMTIKKTELENHVDEVCSLVRQHDVAVVYIGLPLHLSGNEGESALKARKFADILQRKIGDHVQIRLVDERLTTTSAQRHARESGNRLSKENVDQWAAVAILENALHKERSSGELAGVAV